MFIKICGNMEKASVDAAARFGTTHVGFIMTAGFRRSVTAEQVRAMTADLPAGVQKVGVFVNEPVAHVEAMAEAAGLDVIQLHGNENADYIRQLGQRPIIKAVSADKMPEIASQYAEFDNVTLLLDSPKGGSGATFDWASLDLSGVTLPYFVAGGLNPENVAAAIRQFPDCSGVDVSSGVETSGAKDLEKIAAFIQNANDAREDHLLAAFLDIAQALNSYHIFPYLLGSFGVQLLCGFALNPDDIDIQLRAGDFADFERIKAVMTGLGYVLTDAHEHKFAKGSVQVGFASVETLKAYADVDYWELQRVRLVTDEEKTATEIFFMPNRAQFIKIYQAAVKDSWRAGKAKDRLILELLEKAE